jgi:hypothetical protein
MRILQLLLAGLPVAVFLITGPAMSVPFDGGSLRSLSASDRMIHEAGYRAYYRYGYRYGARRCQNSPAEC